VRRRIAFLLIPLGFAAVWLLGSDASTGSVEPLGPARRGEVTILFFGDSGTGHPLQYRVAQTMGRVCERLGCDLGLMLGDNVYAGGVPLMGSDDPRLDHVFGKPFTPLRSIDGFRLYSVMGNHDQLAGIEAERTYAESDSLWEIPDLSFPVPGLPDWLHIFGLFTPPIFELDVADPPGDPQRDWTPHLQAAETYLCDPQRLGWKILFGHHPIHSSAHGTAKRMADRLLPVIRLCGVRLYLAGHAHQQEHIPTEDVEQMIQGASSSPREATGWFKSGPTSSFLSEQPGFGVLRASREEIRVNFFDAEGAVLYSWSTQR
jgi:tartrate-resistant acid phosphatase type 5